MVAVPPMPTPVASPREPAAFDTAATAVGADEIQVTCSVKGRVVPSLYLPTAVNCCVPRTAIVAVAGLTSMAVNVASVTVSTVEPDMPIKLALMVAVPAARVVASPREPAALEMAATSGSSDSQVTRPVTSRLLASE
jgi:hypothetical protein